MVNKDRTAALIDSPEDGKVVSVPATVGVGGVNTSVWVPSTFGVTVASGSGSGPIQQSVSSPGPPWPVSGVGVGEGIGDGSGVGIGVISSKAIQTGKILFGDPGSGYSVCCAVSDVTALVIAKLASICSVKVSLFSGRSLILFVVCPLLSRR